MRGDTKVCVGVRNVGDASSEPKYLDEAPLSDAIRFMIQYLGATTMNKRIEIIIGRDPEYTRKRLEESRIAKAVTFEEYDDEVTAMLARGPTDDPEDDWVPPTIPA